MAEIFSKSTLATTWSIDSETTSFIASTANLDPSSLLKYADPPCPSQTQVIRYGLLLPYFPFSTYSQSEES